MASAFVTNNAMRTPQQVTDKLNSMDFQATPDMVMTSAMDIAAIMAEELEEGSKVFVIGGAGPPSTPRTLMQPCLSSAARHWATVRSSALFSTRRASVRSLVASLSRVSTAVPASLWARRTRSLSVTALRPTSWALSPPACLPCMS